MALRLNERLPLLALAGLTWLGGAAAAQTLDTVPDFERQPDFKAIARAPDDNGSAAWGYCSVSEAVKNALASCGGGAETGGGCHLTRVGNNSVAGMSDEAMKHVIDSYRKEIEAAWLARSRASGYSIEFTAYGGEAEGWDEILTGSVKFDPNAECMTAIDGGGASIQCTGYGRFAGNLHGDGQYPVYGELSLSCSNDQEVKGVSVSLVPGVGFGCLVTPGGDRVMTVFGPGSHAVTDRDGFFSIYDSLLVASGLNRSLCGWGLLTSNDNLSHS